MPLINSVLENGKHRLEIMKQDRSLKKKSLNPIPALADLHTSYTRNHFAAKDKEAERVLGGEPNVRSMSTAPTVRS